jgi:hypothetical protein
MTIKSSPMHWVVLLSATVLTGCGDDDIRVYRVPKERTATQLAQANLPSDHPGVGSTARPQLTWKKPVAWNEGPPAEMRVASFNVKGKGGKQADISVVPLSGTAGGDIANVNRWRGQVGQPATTPEELQKIVQKVEIAGQPADLYELTGKNTSSGDPTRVIGVIQHRDGTAWFFKMTGDDEVVAAQKPAFLEFLKSVAFTAGDAQTELPPSHPPLDGAATLPAGHPDISAAPAAAQAAPSNEGKPNWQVPSGWKEIPGGQFLVAKFQITAGDAQAFVNVSMSGGAGGGLDWNVNRWRGQLGLPELSGGEISKSAKSVETAGGKASFVELSGTDARTGKATSLVGAVLPMKDQTWFYKLMGDAKVVESQKEAFTKFVETAKY